MKLDTANTFDCDIMTALRGPDVNDFRNYDVSQLRVIKTITTRVLRYFAGTKRLKTSPEQAKAEWVMLTRQDRKIAQTTWQNSIHFRGHIEMGFHALIEKRRKAKKSAKEVADYTEWLRSVLNSGIDYHYNTNPL